MRHFMVTVSLHFQVPIGDGPDRPRGAYQNFGVLASSADQARCLVVEDVDGASIDWADSQIRELDAEELTDPIFAAARWASTNSVWYRSGRVYFTDDTEN